MKQQRKYRNILFSGIALQRLSDIICLENGLSVIQPRKPSERDRHVFPKVENKRDVIKLAIDVALSKQPKDYEEFLWLLQRQDFEIKRGKHTAVRGKGGERFIRFRSLGDGYRESDIREKIAAMQKSRRSKVPHKKDDSFDLLLNIQDIIAKGKGPGYERWAKKYNIKNLAKALIFFQENDIRSYEELAKRAADSSKNFSELSARIKAAEKRLDEISALREQLINYAKTKDIYVQYKKSGYSKKFFEAHREDIMKHKAAKDTFEKMKGQKIPSVRELNDEFQQVLTQKRKDYSEYHEAKEKMQLYKTAKYDIDRILNQDIEKEKARLQSRERRQTR
ncbi:MAG: relaxase [Butyrivibrio sp.]|nr:relaxase [Butyrivibrio sp.]